MDAQLQNVLDKLRDLDPETIRDRLLEIETEEKALRIILRTSKAAQSLKDRLDRACEEIDRHQAEHYEAQHQALCESGRQVAEAARQREAEGQP